MILYVRLHVNGEYVDVCKTMITPNDANTVVKLLDQAIVYGFIIDEIKEGDLLIEFADSKGNLFIDPTGLTPLFNYAYFFDWLHTQRYTGRLPLWQPLIDAIINRLEGVFIVNNRRLSNEKRF